MRAAPCRVPRVLVDFVLPARGVLSISVTYQDFRRTGGSWNRARPNLLDLIRAAILACLASTVLPGPAPAQTGPHGAVGPLVPASPFAESRAARRSGSVGRTPSEWATRQAEPDAEPRGWLDLGVGGGWVRAGEAPYSDGGSFALDFSGGFWLRRSVGVGAHAGGWTLEGFNLWDPEQGQSFSEVLALLRLRPLGAHPLSLTAEGGWVSYVANAPASVPSSGDGLGWRVTIGWDVWESTAWAVSPTLVAAWGSIDPDQSSQPVFDYAAFGALLRVRWGW